MDNITFFRRRQFLLGPQHPAYDGWRQYHLSNDLCLSVHPDLPVRQVRHGANAVTLLGFLVNPAHVHEPEEETLGAILHDGDTIADILRGFEPLNGRFVAIVQCGDSTYLFGDACGLRQVVYCRDGEGNLWCASQALSLGEMLGFPLDQEVASFLQSPLFRRSRSEIWLPNDITPYREILQLLPNHYLDFASGTARRFWPTEHCITPISVADAVGISAHILKNSIRAVADRFDLTMGISAGIDSRKTLSALREIKERITFFTQAPLAGSSNAGLPKMDVDVPAKLLLSLGLSHHVVEQQVMDDQFRKYFEPSVTCARETKGNNGFNVLRYFGPEVTVLNSNVSEIPQCLYWLPKSRINGEGLATLTGYYHPLAVREFDKWIQGARGPCNAAGLNILALFHWEQKMGRWAAASFSEYDMAHESYTPYNNRRLNIIQLGIDEAYRRNRMWHVSLEMIKLLWPEILREPINPPETYGKRIQQFTRRKVFHEYVTPWLPLYEYGQYLVKKMRIRAMVRGPQN